MLCEYGCGQEAKHQFKNGKWCCSKCVTQCLAVRKKNSQNSKGNSVWCKGKHLSEEHKKKLSKKMKGRVVSKETRIKISKFQKGKYVSDKTRKKLSESRIGKYKGEDNPNWKGGYFSKGIPVYNNFKDKLVEEIRRSPFDKNILEVKCSYNKCQKWFIPKVWDVYHRVECLNDISGMGEGNLYCSDECKQRCSIFGLNYDPFEKKEDFDIIYTQEEYNIWKQIVLKQDSYECQKCGSKENLHCHHIIPVKIEPMFVLDPDNGIVLCQSCHYEIGHKTGTECSTGNLANKKCEGNNK